LITGSNYREGPIISRTGGGVIELDLLRCTALLDFAFGES
jgi:hypothetical protein